MRIWDTLASSVWWNQLEERGDQKVCLRSLVCFGHTQPGKRGVFSREVFAVISITWIKRIPTGMMPYICSQGFRAACKLRPPVPWISFWTTTAVPSKCLTWGPFLWCHSLITHWFLGRSHPGEEPEASSRDWKKLWAHTPIFLQP